MMPAFQLRSNSGGFWGAGRRDGVWEESLGARRSHSARLPQPPAAQEVGGAGTQQPAEAAPVGGVAPAAGSRVVMLFHCV